MLGSLTASDSLGGIKYGRQIVGGRGSPPANDSSFIGLTFGRRFPVHIHELVVSNHENSDHKELLGVGHFIDPKKPTASNRDVLSDLFQQTSTFKELEHRLATLGGRWILLSRFGDELRLYPDAAAQRPIFYCNTGAGLSIASQPGLLASAGVTSSAADIQRLWRSPSAVAWPAALTPYEGVRQLLPNHFLDLNSGSVRRFWPVRPVHSVDFEAGAQEMTAIITGVLAAVSERHGRPALPLTGGIDSRVLFACAKRERFQYFTIVDETSPFHDVWLPQRLAQRFNVDLDFIWATRGGARVEQLLRTNTGGLWRDPNERRTPAFAKIDAPIVVLGNVSEVCRAFYYPYVAQGTPVTAARLAELAGWGAEPLAQAAFQEWISDVPSDMGINLLDLFYWECRLGNWAALDCLALDGFADSLSPFNCRELLTLGLGVDAQFRKAPYALHRRICELAEPTTLSLPINTTFVDALRTNVIRLVPAAVRRTLRRHRGLDF